MPLEIKYPDFPKTEIRWGMLTSESEANIKNWIVSSTHELVKAKIAAHGKLSPDDWIKLYKDFANMIYDNIHQIGYEEGYDSAECDNEGDGL